MIVENHHRHTTKWTVAYTGIGNWYFCVCGCVNFNHEWHTLNDAWTKSRGAYKKWYLKFLQAHDAVVRTVPEELRVLLLAWATNTTVDGIPEDDFDIWLQDYWSKGPRPTNNSMTISIERNVDGSSTYYANPKEHDVNFLVQTQRIKAGVVGQILDGSLGGTVLWESEPQEDQINDDHEVTKSGQNLAIELAEAKLDEVKKGLFA